MVKLIIAMLRYSKLIIAIIKVQKSIIAIFAGPCNSSLEIAEAVLPTVPISQKLEFIFKNKVIIQLLLCGWLFKPYTLQ